MKVSLSRNAWVDAKSDDVIVPYVLGLPYTTGRATFYCINYPKSLFLGLLPVFRALPVTDMVSNYPENTHKTFSSHMQKTVLFLKSLARKVFLRFWHNF